MAVHEQEGRVLFLKKLVAGIAESSYGIYCAERAGLPSALITRAYTLLQGEAPHEGAHAQKEAVSTPPPTYEQLYIQAQASTSSQQWIVQEFLHQLQQWDVLRMTPLAALQHLHELQQRLQEQSLDASPVASLHTEVH
jgi:DNA mismatch repair protein MutS